MKINSLNHPLVKLPVATDFTLYLIKEELKSRKFFDVLRQVGLDDCYYQPNLDALILSSIGIEDGSDEMFDIYTHIIEKRSKKIDADNDSIMKQALKVYHELMIEKAKRQKS